MMKRQRHTAFRIEYSEQSQRDEAKKISRGTVLTNAVIAVVWGVSFVLAILQITCGSIEKVFKAGSFGGILNLFLNNMRSYNPVVHQVYTEKGGMLLITFLLILVATFVGICVFTGLSRGGWSQHIIFIALLIPIIVLQLAMPTEDSNVAGIYLLIVGITLLYVKFAGNAKELLKFLLLLLLTSVLIVLFLNKAGVADKIAKFQNCIQTQKEISLYGGEGSGLTYGRLWTDVANERNVAAVNDSDGEAKNTVLKVSMSAPQAYYLRGYTGDIYAEDGWQSAASAGAAEDAEGEDNAIFYFLDEKDFDSLTMLSQAKEAVNGDTNEDKNVIRVKNVGASRKYLYMPYEAETIEAKGEKLIGGGLRPSKQSAGSYAVTTLPYLIDSYGKIIDGLEPSNDAIIAYRQAESNYRSYVEKYDLDLSAECSDVIEETFPDEKTVGTTGQAKAAIIETLSGMQYDEDVVDSDNGSDFVTQFLERKAGYDKHFATAAVMAFRYYGIPARFAEGYLITDDMTQDAKAGEEIEVTAAQAHCWAEYYEDGVGWLPFEATPTYIGLMQSAGHISVESKPEAEQSQASNEDISKTENETVTTESEVNYMMLAVLILLFILLIAIAIWTAHRWVKGRQGTARAMMQRKDVTSRDRRKAIVALMFYIRKYEYKYEHKSEHKCKHRESWHIDELMDVKERQKIEKIYLEARYSPHDVKEEDYQRIFEYYRRLKKGRQNCQAKDIKNSILI